MNALDAEVTPELELRWWKEGFALTREIRRAEKIKRALERVRKDHAHCLRQYMGMRRSYRDVIHGYRSMGECNWAAQLTFFNVSAEARDRLDKLRAERRGR